MNLRAQAARAIYAVTEGASLSDVLPFVLKQIPDARDQAFVQALCYGVCRRYFHLDAMLQLLLDKPLKAKDQDIYALLLIGLYQLTEMRVPSHAAVAETVDAAKSFKKIWAKGLINAVLRNYLRHIDEITQKTEKDFSALYSHPVWLIDLLKQHWPDDWQEILTANNQHPPFVLRVNQQKISRAAYLEKLSAQELESTAIPETPSGIVLTQPVDVEKLPGFMQGEVSVQDGAAQLVASLLKLEPHLRVLDACAAPGGKTTHMLELQPDLKEVVAVDVEASRLQGVHENLERLQLSAELIVADVGDVESWWDKQLFDRILLDAPCSATGVIRRHPDIKLLRRADDIHALAAEQTHLLTALWPLLKTDGLLVYTTCSILPEENTQVLQAFLAAHPDAQEIKISAEWGNACSIGRQILPGMHGMDGFYFACLRKCNPR